MHSKISSLISSEEAPRLGCKAWVAVWVMACQLFRRMGEREAFTQEHANSENVSLCRTREALLDTYQICSNIGQTAATDATQGSTGPWWWQQKSHRNECFHWQWNGEQGSLHSFSFTFLKALDSCLSFSLFLSFSLPALVCLRECACYTLVRACLCVYMVSVQGHHWVEAMWNEIYQSQWGIVMKALWGNFNHDYSQGPCKVVSFLSLFNENSPQLFWFTGSQYSYNLCCLYCQLNWQAPSTEQVVRIRIIQKLFSMLRICPGAVSLETDSIFNLYLFPPVSIWKVIDSVLPHPP